MSCARVHEQGERRVVDYARLATNSVGGGEEGGRQAGTGGEQERQPDRHPGILRNISRAPVLQADSSQLRQ